MENQDVILRLSKFLEENQLTEALPTDLKSDNCNYIDIVKLLASKNLYTQNKEEVDKLEKYPTWSSGNDDSCETIERGLKYLSEYDLLNQETLSRCLQIAKTAGTPKYSWDSPLLFNPELFLLFKTLHRYEFNIDKATLDSLLAMKYTHIRSIYAVIPRLHEAGLLNNDSLQKIIQRITAKLPPVTVSTVVKKKNIGDARSELILNNQHTIFPDRNKNNQLHGGTASVKKAFSTQDSDQPHMAIKKIGKAHTVRNPETNARAAKYEVKMNVLLKRPAFFYYNTKNKPRAALSWIQGKPFYRLEVKELNNISYENRIRLLASGFSDLNTLHSHHCVHGDVADTNFQVNLEQLTMKLFDFGSSYRMGHKKHGSEVNQNFNDPKHFRNDIYRDVYAMGILCAELFPELYSIKFIPDNSTVTLIKQTDLTTTEQAIVNLVDALMDPDLNSRCTSQDALDYCHQLMAKMDQHSTLNLTPSELDAIKTSSIRRETATVEDVLRKPKY